MKEFRQRVLSIESENFNMEVHRSRNSNDYKAIWLIVGDVRIQFSSTDYGDKYEVAAAEAAELLTRMCAEDCKL